MINHRQLVAIIFSQIAAVLIGIWLFSWNEKLKVEKQMDRKISVRDSTVKNILLQLDSIAKDFAKNEKLR
jgi:hypothetical protein